MISTLIASCGSNDVVSTTTSPAATSTAGTDTTPAPNGGTEGTDSVGFDAGIIAPAELPHGTDNLAVTADGKLKYEISDIGYPLESYEYELPLTTNTANEKFTLSKLIFASQLIGEDGLNAMPWQTWLRDNTGVNIDYRITTFNDIATQIQLDLAADQLDDIILDLTVYYSGTPKELVDQKYIVNIADYRAYMPDMMWQIPRFDFDVDLEQYYWYDKETIPTIYCMTENSAPNMGMMIRGDYLDTLGLKAEDLVTYDQIHDALTRIQTELSWEHPMQITATIETLAGVFFGGMNTSEAISTTVMTAIRVENSKVVYTATEDVDRQAMELLSTWYAEGLVDPNYLSNATDTAGAEARVLNGEIAYWESNPGTSISTARRSVDPNARWDGMPLNKLTPETKFQYARGQRPWGMAYSVWSINAKCENIPLVLTYADWFFSSEGSFQASFGVEGITWVADEKGNPVLTDLAINDETGGWLLDTYAGGPFSDVGLMDQMRSYAYPEGQRGVAIMKSWVVDNYPFKGGMDWPSSNAKGTDEETLEVANLSADALMYINENYMQFIDGTRPMSAWDDYVAGLDGVGLPRIKQIMQSIYDRFIAEYPDYAQK
ncbi:MAG: extracellular solute-binding protein [Oscillospiraceae bacterium]|nr:extracellular solute-binding protein [Oscillospiraceae bacterium]